MSETGVWLVGARGNVATMTAVGARAIARDVADATGLVTERAALSDLSLPAVDDLVFAGHDVREGSLVETARTLSAAGAPDRGTVDAVAEDLRAIDDRIERGSAVNAGAAIGDLADDDAGADTLRAALERIREDLRSFVDRRDLDRLVVVNVASTEPAVEDPERFDSPAAIERAIEADDPDFPPSALYAYAAIDEGHPFVNFTPSTGSALPGLRALAEAREVPHAGRDAKTGETLVKSALAPMFAGRNLRVRSWEGHNVLGNSDGEVLETAENEAGKQRTKGGVLDSILPNDPHNAVRIDYTPSLGDRKTAWDYVHFEGFLGQEMTLQFTWEGADSALAAPLVIDLVRLVAHADARGAGGLQPHLASFFKEPLGVDEHDLSRQFARLEAYAERHADGAGAE